MAEGPELEKTIKEEEIDVLFEYKGSRKDCTATHSTLCLYIEQQLRGFGESEAIVSVPSSGSGPESSDQVFLLQ